MTKTKKPKKTKEDSDDEYEVESENVESEYEDEEIEVDEDESEVDFVEEGEEGEQPECIVEKIIEDDNDFFEINDSDIKQEIIEKMVEPSKRISPNRLTKYEMVRILGERTKQLTLGAKPMIKNYQSLSYDKIAEEELKLNMIPYKIKRPLPNGRYEIWTLDELKKEHLLSYLE
jgi:DNA-directed RNA polymerase subunit K/omega